MSLPTSLSFPYASKVLFQEFMAMNFIPKMSVDKDGIRMISFCTLTPEEWKIYCNGREVTNPVTKSTVISANTIEDPSQGTINEKEKCHTCGLKGSDCQNHFMCIPLEIPVYNKLFIKEIVHFLNCICIECGNLRKKESQLYPALLEVPKKDRLVKAKNVMAKIATCGVCSASLCPYNYDKKDLKKMRVYSENDKSRISPWKVYEVFQKVKNSTCDLLGFISKTYPEDVLKTNIKPDITFFRPESMLFVYFPVLPISGRPWIETNGIKNNDDLTDMYNQLVKINFRIKNYENGKTKKSLEQLEDELQIAANFIISAKDMQKNKMTKKKRGISDRISGKDGHIINNVTGKRCNFTGRMVITSGGFTIPFGSIGVPREKAAALYKKEIVTTWNKERCEKLLAEGKVRYIEIDGKARRSKYLPKSFYLSRGQAIYREIEDGDLVNINRQPSIRTESIQAMRVKLIDHYAMRLPPATTRAFNADYDGDEMNLSVPQNSLARAEMLTVGNTKTDIVTAQSNIALMSCIQNVITFFYLITAERDPPVKIPYQLFCDCIADPVFGNMDDIADFFERAKKYHRVKKSVDGKVVASIIFPRDFYWRVNTGTDSNRPEVKIESGIILPDSGPICKKIIGQGNTAIQYVWKFYSPTEAAKMINRANKIAYPLLSFLGFSIGISDTLVKSKQILVETIRSTLLEAQQVKYSEADPELREIKIREVLNNAMSVVPKMAATQLYKGKNNSYTLMKISGTKGNDSNTGMMAAFLAQQNIDGKRPRPVLTGGKRTCIHVKPDEGTPESRGFVKNSFLTGLTLVEAVLQAHAGRRGVIDTAAKTSTSGYSQKKIGKKTEDCMISPEGGVTNSSGGIYNFLYGDDGMNPKELIRVKDLPFPFFFDPVTEAKRLSGDMKTSKLPKATIDTFCDYMRVVSPDFSTPVTRQINANLANIMRGLLEKVEIAPKAIEKFAQSFIVQFHKSQITHGSTVGMTSCLSVGEIVIQLTMDTHRNVGGNSADVTSGLPRLKECIEVTRNPSSRNMSFQLLCNPTKEEAMMICNQIRETHLGELITNKTMVVTRKLDPKEFPYMATIYDYSIEPRKEWWVEKYCSINSINLSTYTCPWVWELEISRKQLFERGLTLVEICSVIDRESYDPVLDVQIAKAIPSPLVMGKIWVYFDSETVQKKTMKRKGEIPGFITPENQPYYFMRDSIAPFLKELLVSGIEGVKKVYVEFKGDQNPVAHFTTKGSNLRGIMDNYPVDMKTLKTNDFWEMADVYGFQVGKACLLEEIEKAISSSGNSSLNRRHLQVLVDSMCRTGIFTPSNRHGIRDNGVISQMLFETGVDVARQASLYGKTDTMNSISSCVVAGRKARIGNQNILQL